MNRRGFLGWLAAAPLVAEVIDLIGFDTDELPSWVRANLDQRGHWVVHNPVAYDVMFKQVTGREWMINDA